MAKHDYVSLGRENTDGGFYGVSLADVENIAARVPELSLLYRKRLPAMGSGGSIRPPDGAVRDVQIFAVPGDFFHILGVQPHIGGLTAPEGTPAVVLAHALWRDAYAAKADISGELLHIAGGASVPIAGVAPPGFIGIVPSQAAQVWLLNARFDIVPEGTATASQELFQRVPNVGLFGAFGESSRGADSTDKLRALIADYRFDTALIEVEQIASAGNGTDAAHGAGKFLVSFGIGPHDRLVVADGLENNPTLRREVAQKTAWLVSIVALLMAMTLVLLVDFLLAEHVLREEEQAVRIALGATPLDMFRQTLAENAVWLAAVAVLAWFAFGYMAELLLGIAPFSTYIRALPTAAQVAGSAIGGTMLTVAFCAAAAYQSWFVSRASRSFHATRAASKLPQAMRCVLLTVASASLLFVLSLVGRYGTDARLSLGVRNPDALMVQVHRQLEFGDARAWTTPEGIAEAVAAIPGISSAGHGDLWPLDNAYMVNTTRGKIADRPGLAATPFFKNAVAPEFFSALGVPLVAGKMFGADSTAEAVLSRSAAAALAGDPDDALGLALTFQPDAQVGQWRPSPATVVGVVEDVPYGDYARASKRVIYFNKAQLFSSQKWVIAYSGEPADLVDALQRVPQLADWEITVQGTPATEFRKQFVAKRSVEIVLAAASAFALLLALAGVANSLARTVAQGHRSIGIAFALGATSAQVGHRYFGDMLRDLAVAATLVSVGAVVAKLTAPAFAAVLAPWLLVPMALCLMGICASLSYGLVRRLARRSSANTLIHGSVR